MTAEERAGAAFDAALAVANLCPLPEQAWFRDAKRHLIRQAAAAIEAAVLEEREACASSCQNRLGSCIQTRDRTGMDPNDAWREGFLFAVRSDAEGIRGRSQYSAEFRDYLAECREGREQAAQWEREACAKLAATYIPPGDDHYGICHPDTCYECERALNIAAAIRARR